MTSYYRAYLLRDMRRFTGWTESAYPAQDALALDTVVYLRDDFHVVQHPVQADEGMLWDTQSPQWRAFCESDLRFELPDEPRIERS